MGSLLAGSKALSNYMETYTICGPLLALAGVLGISMHSSALPEAGSLGGCRAPQRKSVVKPDACGRPAMHGRGRRHQLLEILPFELP